MNCLEWSVLCICKEYPLLYIAKSTHPWLYGRVETILKNPQLKIVTRGKVSSIFVSDIMSVFRLLPTNLTSDSNLFLIKFIFRWPMIILLGFWFLSFLSLQMPFVFLSIIGSEGGLSDFPETLCSTSSDWLLGEKVRFKFSTGIQNFRTWFRKFNASLPLPFGFRCNLFRPRCWALMLPCSIHSKFKVSRCLLTLRSVWFAFPWSIRTVGLKTITLQFESCFKILDFSMSRSFFWMCWLWHHWFLCEELNNRVAWQ